VNRSPWTVADIPELDGRTVVVTGSNSGIGLETAAALAAAGATVVMACRNLTKAATARAEIEARSPRGPVELLRLDLADQGQIAEAAAEAIERFGTIDRLVNNAGVMAVPFSRTVDGFETVIGTNHLGHFAFTGRILPALLATPGSRGRHGLEHVVPARVDPLGRPRRRPQVPQEPRVRAVEAGEPALRVRAATTSRARRSGHDLPRGPPRGRVDGDRRARDGAQPPVGGAAQSAGRAVPSLSR